MTSLELERISKSAKINLEKIHIDTFIEEVNEVLNFIKEIDRVNLENVESFEHPLKEKVVLREDIVLESYPIDLILENAPKRQENFIEVPKIL